MNSQSLTTLSLMSQFQFRNCCCVSADWRKSINNGLHFISLHGAKRVQLIQMEVMTVNGSAKQLFGISTPKHNHPEFLSVSAIPLCLSAGKSKTFSKLLHSCVHDPLWLFYIQGLHLNEDPFYTHHPPVTFAPLFFNSQFRFRFHQTNHVCSSDSLLLSSVANHLSLRCSKLVKRVRSCIKGNVEANLLKWDASDRKRHTTEFKMLVYKLP